MSSTKGGEATQVKAASGASKMSWRAYMTLAIMLLCGVLMGLTAFNYQTDSNFVGGMPPEFFAPRNLHALKEATQNAFKICTEAEAAYNRMREEASLINKTTHDTSAEDRAHLQLLADRFSAVEEILKSQDERIDNIWDALGPPSQDGTYRFDTVRYATEVETRVQKMREDLQAGIVLINKEYIELLFALRRMSCVCHLHEHVFSCSRGSPSGGPPCLKPAEVTEYFSGNHSRYLCERY